MNIQYNKFNLGEKMLHRSLTDDETKALNKAKELKEEEKFKAKWLMFFIKIKTFFSNIIF